MFQLVTAFSSTHVGVYLLWRDSDGVIGPPLTSSPPLYIYILSFPSMPGGPLGRVVVTLDLRGILASNNDKHVQQSSPLVGVMIQSTYTRKFNYSQAYASWPNMKTHSLSKYQQKLPSHPDNKT